MNWVLDADIRGFYDAIDHGWMLKFLEHRIADENDGLHWPHRDGLKWPHLASVVLLVDVA